MKRRENIEARDRKTGLKSFEDHLDERYGRNGTKTRDNFEKRSKSFIVGEMLKQARLEVKMTQDELARRAKTKKSYISRLENGKIDVQVSTFFRIVEDGLGRTVQLSIR